MKIADFFAEIGLKGGKEAQSQLGRVNSGMISISKSGLAAITAITGISYGFTHLYSTALQAGIGFNKFEAFTGQSAQELQRWQYIAKQSGASAEDMEGSVKGLQSSLANMRMNGPTGEFLRFADAVKLDFDKAQDTFYVLGKLKEFLKDNRFTTDIQNQIAGSLGVAPDIIGALRSSKLNPEDVPGWAIRSKGKSNALAGLSVAGKNLQDKIQASFENVLIKVGPELIKAMNDAIPAITNLTKAILDLTGWFIKQLPKIDESIENGKKNGFFDWSVLDPFIKPSDDEMAASVAKIKSAIRPPSQGIQNEMSADIMRMKGEEAPKVEVNINQTITGVNRDNANSIAREAGNKAASVLRKTQVRGN